MGRKTYESLPGRLPNRRIMVLTRHPRRLLRERPEVYGAFREWRGGGSICTPYQLGFPRVAPNPGRDLLLFNSLDRLRPERFSCEIFICGGAEVYAQALPLCSDLFLTVVNLEIPDGDAFFPPFEQDFEWVADLRVTGEFRIRHFRNRRLA
ncbi:MAG: dihydrofolate reductase [Verrucomicrobiales bacterium]|nr:dihydrofolate reductase [Verrucomicrobiales bacterium]